MTRKDCAKARVLVEGLLKIARKGTAAHAIASELQELLQPGPTLGEIILALPSENHKERARMIGISRQGYYNLVQGTARPNTLTTKRLADLTGLAEDVIKAAGP